MRRNNIRTSCDVILEVSQEVLLKIKKVDFLRSPVSESAGMQFLKIMERKHWGSSLKVR